MKFSPDGFFFEDLDGREYIFYNDEIGYQRLNIRRGIGYEMNARAREHWILTGKKSSGEFTWTPKSEWDAAIRAGKNGTATQDQREMLNHGHW